VWLGAVDGVHMIDGHISQYQSTPATLKLWRVCSSPVAASSMLRMCVWCVVSTSCWASSNTACTFAELLSLQQALCGPSYRLLCLLHACLSPYMRLCCCQLNYANARLMPVPPVAPTPPLVCRFKPTVHTERAAQPYSSHGSAPGALGAAARTCAASNGTGDTLGPLYRCPTAAAYSPGERAHADDTSPAGGRGFEPC
jgi:hypothetical protein